jgi:predicted nuclease with TOPRIM domain
MPGNAAEELKKTILDRIAERNKLKKSISGLDAEIKELNKSYKILSGESLLEETKRRRPALDYAEDLLKEHGRLHVDEVVALLESEFGIVAPKQSISSGLIRFHNQGKRFERVAKNTFALRK